jgi:hypothetical protein
VTGGRGQFIGSNPSINISGVRVLRFQTKVLAAGFAGGAIVVGNGTCPSGPGTFRVTRVFPFPPVRWLLRDVTS